MTHRNRGSSCGSGSTGDPLPAAPLGSFRSGSFGSAGANRSVHVFSITSPLSAPPYFRKGHAHHPNLNAFAIGRPGRLPAPQCNLAAPVRPRHAAAGDSDLHDPPLHGAGGVGTRAETTAMQVPSAGVTAARRIAVHHGPGSRCMPSALLQERCPIRARRGGVTWDSTAVVTVSSVRCTPHPRPAARV